MQKTSLFESIDLYTFRGSDEFNLLVLVDQKNALLIDSGYPQMAKTVHLAFEQAGIIATTVINSHYHPDHINGNYVFTGCQFLGSEHYQQNFQLFAALNPDIPYIAPEILIKDGQMITHGPFELHFFHLPGHSRDSLVIQINHQRLRAPIVHVADLLMFSNSGQHSIPYLSYDGSIDDHIQSLKTISTMDMSLLIPSHGNYLKTKSEIKEAIQLRLYYLERLKELGRNAKIEDCLIGSTRRYNLLHFHTQNIKNIFG